MVSIIIPKYAPKIAEAPPVSIKAMLENILFGSIPYSEPLHLIRALIH